MAHVTHRRIRANGIGVHVAEAGRGPLVVLLHGFPELWYSWRHQLDALAEAGHHAAAPDVRGYGDTDAPPAVERYRMRELVDDVAGLLDALHEDRAALVGHDWGARIAWHFAQLHPERVAALVALGVPFSPRLPTVAELRRFSGTAFNFALYFQEPGVAEAELGADARRTVRLFLHALSGDAPPDLVDTLYRGKPASAGALDGMPEPDGFPPWLGEKDLDVYARSFARTGFRGALNRYRNLDRDAAELAHLADVEVAAPALFIGGDRDPAVRFASLEPMKARVPNLRDVVLLAGCGHWTQQERPGEVNARMIQFLRRELARDSG
jgi:pimeloyl-ACP methyl ester carboxylesterase